MMAPSAEMVDAVGTGRLPYPDFVSGDAGQEAPEDDA
jgi:hypothetical protein